MVQPASEPHGLALEIERNVEAPAVARAVVAGLCADDPLTASQGATLALLTSEVVSNAVLHSSAPLEAPIVLAMTLRDDVIRVEVTDAGSGFTPEPQDPVRASAGRGGYGLYLLDRAAWCWGVKTEGETRVWFELRRESLL